MIEMARAGPDKASRTTKRPRMPLGIGEPMGGAIGPEQARLGQGARIPSVGLHLARPGRIHRREVRVRDDDLVAERLQAAGHPFTMVEASVTIQARGRVPSTASSARLGPDAPLDDLTTLGEDVDLAFRLCTSMPIWSMAGLSSLRR
jgi:hypothetical protein